MKTIENTNDVQAEAYTELERGVYAALETYSNVHRGSGHNSMVSTHLFEQARDIVLEYMGLSKNKYTVIFCTPRRAAILKTKLEPESHQTISSQDIGLSIGVSAVAVKRKTLPKGAPFQTGGGTTRLISKNWVIWADVPDKFEAGTPAIINIIAFAKALRLIQQYGKDIFKNTVDEKRSVTEILYQDELEKYSGQELLNELKQTLIGKNILVPTVEGAKPFINFDNSASTPTFIPIWNAFRQTCRQTVDVKKEIIDEVKTIIAKMLNAPLADYDVVFTSNTTEAINLVAESLSNESDKSNKPVVVNTFLEHSSNDLPWRMISDSSLIRLSIDADGLFDLNELEKLLNEYNNKCLYGSKRIKIVAVSGASNVLGICNNLKEISRIVHQYGAKLLVDAAQLVAHRKENVEEAGIDYLAFSAHKVYAPFGCGVLLVRKGLLNFNSNELELIKSSGEENVGGIAALGKALVLLQRIGMDIIQKEEQTLTELALRGMGKITDLKIYGIKDPDSPMFVNKIGVIVFSLKNMMPNNVAKELALQRGIGVRYGCHCAHIIIKHLLNVSPFLERFQKLISTLFPKLRFPGVVRVSIGIENNIEDVHILINILDKIAKKPLTSTEKHTTSTDSKEPNLTKAIVKQQMNDFAKASALKVYSQH